MAQALGVSDGDRLADALRAAGLPGMVDEVQAGVARRVQHRGERRERMGLLARQADADDAVRGMLLGQFERPACALDRTPP